MNKIKIVYIYGRNKHHCIVICRLFFFYTFNEKSQKAFLSSTCWKMVCQRENVFRPIKMQKRLFLVVLQEPWALKKETLKMKMYGQCYCFSAQKWQGFERKSSKIPKSQNIWARVAGASWQCKHAGVTLGYGFLQVSPLSSANDVPI